MDCDENHVILDAQSMLHLYSIVKNSDPYPVDLSHDQLYFGIEHLIGITDGKPLKGGGGKLIFTIVDKRKWLLAQIKHGFK